MTTNNTEYGTGRNAADGIARAGRKTQRMEREIERQVAEEMRQKKEALEAREQERYFDTTNAENFDAKDLTQNTVGRKVMRT